jgi:hypothetical protein
MAPVGLFARIGFGDGTPEKANVRSEDLEWGI